ncbi:Oxygen regulatory protein NreC [Phycisphaerae bacterium RAS1]|nr:Oxygen regulatory protein NreC [Phycisphaerae bacterium RAS1]
MARSALDRLAYGILLRDSLGLSVAVESGFAPPAVWDAMRRKPDLVLVVADQATSDVIDSVEMIPRLRPDARIVVLSAAVDPASLSVWSDCRLSGYVVKDGGLAELKQAFDAILRGGQYFSEGARPGRAASATPHRQLSRRESELLPLLARGLTLREAATRMTVSYKTADSYRTSLLRKLGVRDRVELARYAIREKIVEA